MTVLSPIFGKPASATSYEVERVDRQLDDIFVATRICQGGASENFKGTRPTAIAYQQDRGFAFTTDRTITEKNLKDACEQATSAGANCIDGSTVSVAALNPTGPLIVANLADSPVSAFAITKTGQVYGHYLIQKAHYARPRIPVDLQRVPAEYRNDANLRNRFYDISVTHAVGDFMYGLKTECDVNSYELAPLLDQAGPGGQLFLCVASDGISPPFRDGIEMHDDRLWVTHFAIVIQARLQQGAAAVTCDMIADWIVEETISQRKAQEEQDNILVHVTELIPHRTKTLILAVCDGHRPADLAGADFAGKCAQQTAEVLRDYLAQ